MIVFLRGHIRNSFENDDLYQVLKELRGAVQIEIYIQTWSVLQTSISWRELEIIETPVTEKMIYDYFKDLSGLIKRIMILDDSQLRLIGNTHGNVGDSKAPMIGWKNMWYGKYEMMNYIKNVSHPYQVVLNIRFDVLNNSQVISKDQLVDFVERNQTYYNETKNVFIYSRERWGIDNIYIGNITPMHKLISLFHFRLDDIIREYYPFNHQEFLVFFVNDRLFSNTFDQLQMFPKRWASAKEVEGYFRKRNWL